MAPNILIAEDDSTNAYLIRSIVESMSFSAQTSSNGIEALIALSRDKFDLLITDVRMPQLNGLQLIQTIRESEKRKHLHLPIIALTGDTDSPFTQELLLTSTDYAHAKPVDVLLLQKQIRQLVNKKKRRNNTAYTDLKLSKHQRTELHSSFINNCHKYIEDAKHALNSKQFETIQDIAHALRGATQWANLRELIETSTKLEAAAKMRDENTIQKCITLLETKAEQLSKTDFFAL